MIIIKDYLNLLDQLRDGTISELVVTPDEFMAFQPVLMDFPDRKLIIGEAGREGKVIYRFEHNENGTN